ncbi:MAG TPA: hypothetical protein VGI74_22545 [Streptosporangiaceae bacterium]
METATQTLHRLTSYATWDPDHGWEAPVIDPRVLVDLKVNDVSRFPWFFKRYRQELPRTPLPRNLPPTRVPAVAVLAGTADVRVTGLGMLELSRLLHLSAGVVRTSRQQRGLHLYRAAGSAGARFPLELYVAVPEGERLPAGVHWYHPRQHALVQVGPPPRGGVPALIVTGVPWRTGWRYRERGYRHIYWDSGTLMAHVLAAADSGGFPARLHTRFPDEAVAALVGADRVHEFPVAVVALGAGEPALQQGGAAAVGGTDAAPLEFPLVTAAQQAGELDTLGPPWERGAPVEVPVTQSPPVEAVVLTRGSQRRMDPSRGLPADLLRTCLPAALRGVMLPHRLVVNDVAGLAPGVYRYPDLAAPVRPGALRSELFDVCLNQGLPRDAAFVMVAGTDVSKLDDREYREASLAAGLVEGRLHLLAYGLGACASGMTFIDAKVPALLGEPLDALLFTCVGVPAYESAHGGMPGAPVMVRSVAPLRGDHE